MSILDGTILYQSNLPVSAWFYAMLLFANSSIGVRSTFLRKQLGSSARTVVRMSNLIRLHMAAMERPARLGGPGKTVYVDEAYIPYVAERVGRELRRAPLIVLGLACDDAVVSGIIADRRRETIMSAIERLVKPGSTIVTDGHQSYQRLSRMGWNHIVVNHSRAFHDFKGNSTNKIETYWRVLKRTLSGYRRVDIENFWLYLAEVEARYNRRRQGISLFDAMISQFPAIGPAERLSLEQRYDWRLARR